ncbi:glycosyltransferase family 4 protein [Vibrio diabolicus]|nr:MULTISPECIES: glycosyltransferase family 4 protein [Vibrio]MCF7372052.1 glycosyltransferase family 4 protein [Vibrio sp. J2-3(2022)]MCR9304413.1 glycosyltransferase family 4 protein [Vibrio diabolicus]MCS0024713.1 glycosyltransferase family 4 protein [Vibrio antiquarius]MCS0320376.1 glycosyltransferase family 4 protein [Vibrio diabolicus]MCS0446665.1 glycosyltransferase family 4 protein [Vibrio diabolicus]
MKRVVFIHDHRFKEFNGRYYTPSSFDRKFLNYYKSFGDEIYVIAREDRLESYQENLAESSGKGIFFKTIDNLRSFSGLLSINKSIKNIRSVARKDDLVIIRLPSTTGLVAFFSLHKLNKNIIVEVVGNVKESNFLHGSLVGKYLGFIEHYLTKKAIEKSKNTIYITKNYLQKIYPSKGKTEVCPNTYLESTSYDRDKHVFTENKIGLIGSLDVDYKGHEVALNVLKYLNRNGNKWSLYFVGGGDSRRWQNYAKALGVLDSVHFVGVLKPGKEVFNFIDEMSIMLQPSKVEAQGRAIVESMSRGKPVISTNVGGIPELLPKSQLFDTDDYPNMAKKILELASSKRLYRSILIDQFSVLDEFDEGLIKNKRLNFINLVVKSD